MIPTPNSPYVSYDLTNDDLIQGSILSHLQRAVIQNLKMETVEQKLSLTPNGLTADQKESYWQQEAYLRGQLDILTYILETSDVAQSEFLTTQEPSDSSNNPI